MIDDKSVIAVIAGGGNLPYRIITKLVELNIEHIVISIKGFGPIEYPQFEIGQIGDMLNVIKSTGANKVLFCGSVKRPRIFSLNCDSIGRKWLIKLGIKAFLGDDALLKGIRKLLEEEDLQIISTQSILNTLLTPSGLLTSVKPSETDLKDIARGLFVLNVISRADVGQAVIVQEGVILGIEAAEGTACLIDRCSTLKLSNEVGGVLIKTSKLNQDKSIDFPTIGPDTLNQVYNSKLSGIALGAVKTQIIDFEDTIELANKKNIFIIGV